MIRAMIFDLDGTLVQTERLKAVSYAQAAVALCPASLDEATVVEAFKDVVGLSRQRVAEALVERFDLAAGAAAHMEAFGVSTPWQAYVQLRLQIYDAMLADPEILRANQWPHNVALLEQARRWGCATGLATMSHCRQAQRVLKAIGLEHAFDFVATRDDVERGKPDPEIYLLVTEMLGVSPSACLIVEDSPAGVAAGVAAGALVLAVSTPFTRQSLHASGLLPAGHIVDDPAELPHVLEHMMQHVAVQGP